MNCKKRRLSEEEKYSNYFISNDDDNKTEKNDAEDNKTEENDVKKNKTEENDVEKNKTEENDVKKNKTEENDVEKNKTEENNVNESDAEESDENWDGSTTDDSEDRLKNNMHRMLEKALDSVDQSAYGNYLEVVSEIEKTEPTIQKILSVPLLLRDRVRLFQLWQTYMCSPPCQIETIELRSFLIRELDECRAGYQHISNVSEDVRVHVDAEAERLVCATSSLVMLSNIIKLECSEEVRAVAYAKYTDMENMSKSSEEKMKIKQWLNWFSRMPHDRIKALDYSNKQDMMRRLSQRFDEELFGMKEVKEQLQVFLNAKLSNPNMKRCELGLVGPPGVGKTTIARLLSEITGFPFDSIFCGSINSSHALVGSEGVYVGSGPGLIAKSLSRLGYKNGIIFMDEFEKIEDSPACVSALLGITDPSQHHDFRDVYMEVGMDLSSIFFIKSMNRLPTNPALRDRIFPIFVSGYNFVEKTIIVQKFLMPKTCKNSGLNGDAIIISREVSNFLVGRVCKREDKGIRSLEKAVLCIVMRIQYLVDNQDINGNSGVTFSLGRRIEYPVNLTKDLVDKLVKYENDNTSLMYV